MPFIGEQRYKRSLKSFLNIKQWEDESLRSHVTQFNREALLINEADDKVLVTTFTNGRQYKEFLFFICKNNLKTMMNMLYRATKYMNFEDAMIAQVGKSKKRERQDNPRLNGGRKSEKWQKGRQEFKTSFQKDDQLHPTEHTA